MSTRKSTAVNKQTNADSTTALSQDKDATPALRSKKDPDTGSESSDLPTTPTSRDSSQSFVGTDSKRKRRTNSTQSISTPKRATPDIKDTSANEVSTDKNTTPVSKDSKDTSSDKKSDPLNTDSPRTRKRQAVEKSTIGARKLAAEAAAAKNPPLRTSLRGAAKINAAKNASPSESSAPQKGRRKKTDTALYTPVKRERENSTASDNDVVEVPVTKKIKVEQIEEDPEEEILMEIRTEILDEISKDEDEVIEIRDERPASESQEIDQDSTEIAETKAEKTKTANFDDSKDDEVVIIDSPVKSDVQNDENKDSVTEGKPAEAKTQRQSRRKAVAATQDKKVSSTAKVEKKGTVTPTGRRGRQKKVISPNVEQKPTRKATKEAAEAAGNSSKPLSNTPVPENDPDSTKPQASQVSESIEVDEMSNSEAGELIFSTTTDPSRRGVTERPQEPLIIDTTTQNSDEKESIPSTECTAGSEKSASLSPVDLECEGVSAVSVKQFYRKAEFLENNLGIEEDPKLGGIVQNASTGEDPEKLEEETEDEKKTEGEKEDSKKTGENEDEKKSEEENENMKKSEEENENMKKIEGEKPAEEEKKAGEALELAKEESKDETDTKSNTELVEQATSNDATKSPHAVEGSDENDTGCSGSDSLKEGELLVLEDSTEEENSACQKPSESTSGEETQLNASSEKTEGSNSETVVNIKQEIMSEEASDSQKKTEQEIGPATAPNEPKEDTAKCDEVCIKKEIIEKDVAMEVGLVPDTACDSPDKSNEDKIESKAAEGNPIEKEPSPECAEPTKDLVPEQLTEVTEAVLVNGTKNPEIFEGYDDADMEKTANENSAMEIDSGVSDIAENNSNDPNEDLNLMPDVIESVNKDVVVSESENRVNEVISHESPDTVEEKKEILKDIKDGKECGKDDSKECKKEESKDIKTDKEVEHQNDVKEAKDKDIAPIIIRKISETPETLQKKENHLKFLGLLTIKAADEAKIEKQKRRQQLHGSVSGSSKKVNGSNSSSHDGSGTGSDSSTGSRGNGNDNCGNKSAQEYTGTLKTVIKLNRPTTSTQSQSIDKKKSNGNASGSSGHSSTGCRKTMSLMPVASSSSSGAGRVPLKMTFQKGRGRAAQERNANGSHSANEETYYTIQNEGESGPQETVTTHGRKSHHYRSNVENPTGTEAAPVVKKDVVIPEKASSFAIHPGRLCHDQCYYCGGKFGLYDTPCHVAQLKSVERQKKILDNEEKLTVDNCLCDACFRHIDRRANAVLQKKRLSAPPQMESNTTEANVAGSASESGEVNQQDATPIPPGHSLAKSLCFVTNCGQPASHTFRRKGFRKTIRKVLGDDVDMTNLGGRLPICDKHYEVIIQGLECALCKRRLIKNHMHHITQDIQLLEKLLVKQGIPVKLQANPAVCKLCRYFVNLLLKPPEGKTQKAQFVKNYRKRLLHFHNVQQSDDASEAEQDDNTDGKPKPVAAPPAKRGRKPKNLQAAVSTPPKPNSAPITSEDGSSNEVVDVDMDSPIQSLAPTSGQMQLDNDVMVDYDMPVLCDSPSPPSTETPKPSKLQAILQGASVARTNDDISLALRSNPNISMRELFPGEEEMGLQIKVPFGSSSSQRTPEGWTRVQTFLQYDEPTRRLWENLQKPYGNQSSFLRHLILLEKYFRNGDLQLSQNASTNAVAYSGTVQHRLRSYDQSVPVATTSKKIKTTASTPSTSNVNISNQKQQQVNSSSNNNTSNSSSSNGNVNSVNSKVPSPNVRQTGSISVPDPIKKLHSNLTITITPKTRLIPETTPQASTASVVNCSSPSSSMTTTATSDSVLKNNLFGRKNSAIEIIPIGSGADRDSSNRPAQVSLTKQQKLLAAANQLMGEDKTSNPTPNMSSVMPNSNFLKSLNLPPELISINRGGSNSLLITNRNAPPTIAAAKNKTHSSQQQRLHSHLSQQSSSSNRPLRIPPTIIKLPATLSPHERMNSKNWRPTLMPINSGPVRSAPGILYQTADGRKLPSLVQVQSGGKPYLISIQDYNRMCILRREKLMRDQMMKGGKMGGSGAGGSAGNLNNSGGNSLLKGALSNMHSSGGSGNSSAGGSFKHLMPQPKQW